MIIYKSLKCRIYGYIDISIFILSLIFFSIIISNNLVPQEKSIFLLENFQKKGHWTFQKGNWRISNNGLEQDNIDEWNAGCYVELKQSGTIYYEWNVIMFNGILDAGLHIFASHGHLSERGNSYLIWQFRDGFVIYKSYQNRLREKVRFKFKTEKNKLYKCKVKYDPPSGMITIWENSKIVGHWIDNKPFKKGHYISFRTNETHARFSNLKIYRDLNSK